MQPPQTPDGPSCPTLENSWVGFGSFKIDLGRLCGPFGLMEVILNRFWNEFGAKMPPKAVPQEEKKRSEMQIGFTHVFKQQKLILNDPPMKIRDFGMSRDVQTLLHRLEKQVLAALLDSCRGLM